MRAELIERPVGDVVVAGSVIGIETVSDKFVCSNKSKDGTLFTAKVWKGFEDADSAKSYSLI